MNSNTPKNYATIARWLLLSSKFKELSVTLIKNNIRYVPLKGLFFNTLIYPPSEPRYLNDIDILVPSEQFIPACKLLLNNGYELKPKLWDLDASSKIPLDNWPTGLNFVDPITNLNLDLQWHIYERWFLPGFDIELNEIWKRTIKADQKLNVPWLWQLSIQDTLAQLCLHCSKDGMAFVKTYKDLDLYIRSLPIDWDWSLFITLVKKWKIKVISWQVLRVLKLYYQTPFPNEIIGEIQPFFIQKLVLNKMMPTNAVLTNKPCIGKRYPKILKLTQIQNPLKSLLILMNVIFPGKNKLLGRYGNRVPLWSHWQHIFLRFFDQTNK